MIRRAVLVLSALLLGASLVGCGSSEPSESASASGTATSSASAADALVTEGLKQISDGRTEAAGATFRSVLVIDPDNAYALYNLGYLAQSAGDTAAALKQYDAALAADPTLTSALYNKAYLLETTDLEQAVKLYRQVVELDPSNAAAHMRLGFALVHLGDQAAGEKELGQGVKLDPSMVDVPVPSYRK